jgi:diguanylate cyclase (GGDEF)-like protein
LAITQTKGWSAWRWAIAGLSSAYAIVFIYMLIARPGSKEFYHGFFNVYQIAPPLFGGICGIILGIFGKHAKKSNRVGWFLVGLGSLSFSIGQMTWTYIETIQGKEVPFPGWPDAGYLGAYPCLIVGVFLLLPKDNFAGRARQFLDSAITASALGALSWYFMINKMWAASVADPEQTTLGRLIGVAYPIGDIAIIFMALVAFNSLRGDKAGRKSMAILAMGMVLVVFSDTVFTYLTLLDKYETGSWADWGWSFGWMMLGFACLNRLWNGASASIEETSHKVAKGWWIALRAFGPYIGVAAAVGITIGADYLEDHKLQLTTHTEIAFLVGLIVIRQLFMLVENVVLTRKLGSINDDLERRVEERTRQITCMQALTKAVNMTLDVDKVARESAEHTAGLMNADAVAIWLCKVPSGRKSAMSLRHSKGFEGNEEFLDILSSKIHFAEGGSVAITECLSDGRQAMCLITPLMWQKDQVGVVAVVRWDCLFEASEHEFIEVVGVELGSALHNACEHAAAVEAADKDPVTGLLNHRAFHQRFRNMLRKARDTQQPASIMMLDLNNFKLFNDTYGHMAGDQVLKTVASSMQTCFDKQSLCARYGGDEFVVAIPNCDGENAERLAAQLAERLVNLGFTQTGDDRKIPITVSVGIATCPNDAETHHDLLAIADQNLYSAKALETGIVRTNEQQRENRALRTEGSFEVLDALVTAVDNKDRYTRKHSEDVTEYALWIAEELGLSQETMRIIRTAGLLHDVGKIGVPSEVLRKPDRLTPEEYEIIKRHPRLGELIVGAVPGMEAIVDGVRSHHERWDGHGYPDALAGENIPFLGRLLAVPDAFSAMTTDRPYRKGMDWDIALKQIVEHRGTQFDPDIADAFLRAVAKRRATLETIVDAA